MKHLILPVETASRELDAKVLLAVQAARRGIVTTLGVKALVNLEIQNLPRGVYLPPNFNRTSDRIVAIAQDLGHGLAGWDEEGLVWINPEIYRLRRVSRDVCSRLDLLFAWGPEHARALAPALVDGGVDVEIAGHPRADLLRPGFRDLYRDRTAELKAEYGDFILVNSNFGWINYRLSNRVGEAVRDFDALAAKSSFPAGYLRHRAALFDRFVAALPDIARRFPDRRIVVRPHPDEDPAGWLKASGDLPNVLVRYDSELVPWLLAAGHIVHNGCTTAVEAALLDRTAISFRPLIDPPHEIPQPAAVSAEARTLDDLLGLLADPELTDRRSAELGDALVERVASTSGPLATERIVDALDALFERRTKTRRSGLAWMRGRYGALKRGLKKRSLRDDVSSTSNPAYYSHKFPPISLEQMRAKATIFADHLGADTPIIEERSDRVFRFIPRTGAIAPGDATPSLGS